MASELIIQLQDSKGNFTCEKFDHLPSPRSVYIAICFNASRQSEQLATRLKNQLIDSISHLNNEFVKSYAPCGGSGHFNHCRAPGIEDNLKLLIVVSDGTNATFANPDVLGWGHRILPVCQSGSNVLLPRPFATPNAVFWNAAIDEVIPTIYGIIGISDEDLRIFISYKRTDTSAFAEQLFDELTHAGFEVFLDRFSIEPGVNFQNRLYQELADKAMVVFLESTHFLASPWIQLEVAFAKQYRLGVLALNIDRTIKISSVDDEFREKISLQPTGLLTGPDMEALVNKIKEQHSIALYRKRNYLNEVVLSALNHKGAAARFDANGFICVTNPATHTEYKILPTPRPPRVNDYYYSDISDPAVGKVIFGPEFMEKTREDINTWLTQKSDISFYNEGQLLNLVNTIYP